MEEKTYFIIQIRFQLRVCTCEISIYEPAETILSILMQYCNAGPFFITLIKCSLVILGMLQKNIVTLPDTSACDSHDAGGLKQ